MYTVVCLLWYLRPVGYTVGRAGQNVKKGPEADLPEFPIVEQVLSNSNSRFLCGGGDGLHPSIPSTGASPRGGSVVIPGQRAPPQPQHVLVVGSLHSTNTKTTL